MLKKVLIFLVLGFILIPPVSADPDTPNLKSIMKIGGSVAVPKDKIVQRVIAVGGSVTVAGEVKYDVVSIGGSVVLKRTAKVGGNVYSVGGKVQKHPAAEILGESAFYDVPEFEFTEKKMVSLQKNIGGAFGVFNTMTNIAYLILIIIIAALFTKQVGLASYIIEQKPMISFFIGLVAAGLVPFVIVLLVMTIIGIALVPLFITLVIASVIFGMTVVAQLIGKKLLKAIKQNGKPMLLEVAVGVVIIFVVSLIPFIGGLIKIILALAGLGGVIYTRFGTYQPI